jgi:hypothetical protein
LKIRQFFYQPRTNNEADHEGGYRGIDGPEGDVPKDIEE